jgi:hypothetical protein
MKNKTVFIAAILFLFSFFLSACLATKEAAVSSPVEGWAVLAEKDDYSAENMTPLPVDHIDVERMRGALIDQGWDPENIHELKEFTKWDLLEELDWLEANADGNDIVFFYINSHGEYLRRILGWNDFFPGKWRQVNSSKRVLLVDSCSAARYTKPVKKDPEPHLSIAAVDQDEFGWKGLEEEGLPIVGGVFTYYFAEALSDPEADTDQDGAVSVQEAAALAEENQRDYMHGVVFEVEEFVEMNHALGDYSDQNPAFPDVIIDDAIGEPLFLSLP